MWLGILIGVSTSALLFLLVHTLNPDRYQGEMTVTQDETGKLTYMLEINENPDGFQHMDSIRFKVVKDESAG